MHEEFWQTRWRANRIGFHESQPNNLLLENFHRLELQAGHTVFVPLCGKSVDLDWLLAQELRVVGIEFNQQAVEEVFARQNITPEVEQVGALKRFSAERIDIFVGDFFDLNADQLTNIDAIYDRAAMVALPKPSRKKYAPHLTEITKSAQHLLVTFDYDQEQMEGPPFSVTEAEVRALYAGRYEIELLASRAISGSLSNRCQGSENTWLLKAK